MIIATQIDGCRFGGDVESESVGYIQYGGVYEWKRKYYNTDHIPSVAVLTSRLGGGPLDDWIKSLAHKMNDEDSLAICRSHFNRLSDDAVLALTEKDIRKISSDSYNEVMKLFENTVVGALTEDQVGIKCAVEWRITDKERFAARAMPREFGNSIQTGLKEYAPLYHQERLREIKKSRSVFSRIASFLGQT